MLAKKEVGIASCPEPGVQVEALSAHQEFHSRWTFTTALLEEPLILRVGSDDKSEATLKYNTSKEFLCRKSLSY